jgi:hypothetical protein
VYGPQFLGDVPRGGMTVLKLIVCVAACLLLGCAGVTVRQLTPDMTSTTGPRGLVYYMPTPYLLVAELPPTATVGQSTNSPPPSTPSVQNPRNRSLPKAAAPPYSSEHGPAFQAPGAAAKPKTGKPDSTSTADGTASPAPASDTSFGGNTPQYVMKLVYLPDKTRPMAMNESTGLFGTSSMKPALQDGWMLTSLDASADSKTAETLTALGSIAGAVAGGAAGGAPKAKSLASAPGGGQTSTQEIPLDLAGYFVPGHFILRPGLYKFEYDKDGALTNLKPVTFFTGCGAIKADNPSALSSAESSEPDCRIFDGILH